MGSSFVNNNYNLYNGQNSAKKGREGCFLVTIIPSHYIAKTYYRILCEQTYYHTNSFSMATVKSNLT